MIDKKGQIKLADFGCAKNFEIPILTMTHWFGTRWYKAPEILMGKYIRNNFFKDKKNMD